MSRRRYGQRDHQIANLEAVVARLSASHGGEDDTARVITADTEPVIVSDFAPTIAGKILCVVQITPLVSGLIIVNAGFLVSSSVADTPTFNLWANALTTITGGTPVASVLPAGAIVASPTSTTPAYNGTGSDNVAVTAQATSVVGIQNLTPITFAGVPVLAELGVKIQLTFFVTSSSNSTTWAVLGTFSVLEQA